MLEKRGGFAITIFPEGLVLSWDCLNQEFIVMSSCPNTLKSHILFRCVKCIWKILCEFHISPSHTVHDEEIWIICKEYAVGWYTDLYPRYDEGLFH